VPLKTVAATGAAEPDLPGAPPRHAQSRGVVLTPDTAPHEDKDHSTDINPWVPIGAWVLWTTILLGCWAVVTIMVWAFGNRFDPEDMACAVTILLIGGAALTGWRRLDAILARSIDAPRTRGRRLLVPGLVVAAIAGVLSGLSA
jgi:protein-S-isoprenylcysteine O-methyltransferase Ste14